MVAVESSASNVMRSGMDRRGGIGASITAAGSLPLSITTSARARTLASSPEVAGRFHFRAVDHMVSHTPIIPLFHVLRFCLPGRQQFRASRRTASRVCR